MCSGQQQLLVWCWNVYHMFARRDASNLDKEWRYHHILSVKPGLSNVKRYYTDGRDWFQSDSTRRGGHYESLEQVSKYFCWGAGLDMGQIRASPKTFFRTAVHEIGHAMDCFTTVNSALWTQQMLLPRSANPPATPFQQCNFSFAEDDKRRLRHYAIYVVPGGTGFRSSV